MMRAEWLRLKLLGVTSDGMLSLWKRPFESSTVFEKPTEPITIFIRSFPRKSGSIFF